MIYLYFFIAVVIASIGSLMERKGRKTADSSLKNWGAIILFFAFVFYFETIFPSIDLALGYKMTWWQQSLLAAIIFCTFLIILRGVMKWAMKKWT
jgi:uncharacterized membrane protein